MNDFPLNPLFERSHIIVTFIINVKSSGYYVEDNDSEGCRLNFWIDENIKSDINLPLEVHTIKDYLNHLSAIQKNLKFDINK